MVLTPGGPWVTIWTDHTNGTVNRVVVLCPHPEAIFHCTLGNGQLMDDAIQLAVDLAGLDIPLNRNYFDWLEKNVHNRTGSKQWSCNPQNMLACLVTMMAQEAGGLGPQVSYQEIPTTIKERMFERWFNTEASEANMRRELLPKCPMAHVSIVKGLHTTMVQRSVETSRAKGFPNLALGSKAIVKMRAGGKNPTRPPREYQYNYQAKKGQQETSELLEAESEKVRQALQARRQQAIQGYAQPQASQQQQGQANQQQQHQGYGYPQHQYGGYDGRQ